MIELLESRIAPAAVLHFTDVDGDKITVTTSKGTKDDLTAACAMGPLGLAIDLIATAQTAQDFAGTNLTVAVHKGPGGNGSVEVPNVHAYEQGGPNNINLGAVTIAGNLGWIKAGTNDSTKPAVRSLTVNSITDNATGSDIEGTLLTARVLHDMSGSFFASTIAKMTIGGSVAGGASNRTGQLSATNINNLTIAGEVRGGGGQASGVVYADNTLGAITIKGGILGGSGDGSGAVVARILGKAAVGGDVQGGSGSETGVFPDGGIACNTFTSITIKGSLLGGSGNQSGFIDVSGMVLNGALSIGKNVIGGTGNHSGAVAVSAGLGTLTIGGKLDGNNQSATQFAGAILSPAIGRISVGQLVNGAQIGV